jgi:hypothetical protein
VPQAAFRRLRAREKSTRQKPLQKAEQLASIPSPELPLFPKKAPRPWPVFIMNASVDPLEIPVLQNESQIFSIINMK